MLAIAPALPALRHPWRSREIANPHYDLSPFFPLGGEGRDEGDKNSTLTLAMSPTFLVGAFRAYRSTTKSVPDGFVSHSWERELSFVTIYASVSARCDSMVSRNFASSNWLVTMASPMALSRTKLILPSRTFLSTAMRSIKCA